MNKRKKSVYGVRWEYREQNSWGSKRYAYYTKGEAMKMCRYLKALSSVRNVRIERYEFKGLINQPLVGE